MNKGKLIIISGPSGAGKGTVLAEVFLRMPDLKYSVSATTRSPRPGEVHGVQYYFISKEDFENRIQQGEMLEYAEYCGNYYGTPLGFVEEQRVSGKNIVLEKEPCGAMQVMKKCPDAMSIFILPPSVEELRRRLSGRGTEPKEVVEARIAKAIEEMAQKDEYDFAVVNDTVYRAAEEIEKIIKNNF